MPRGSAFGRASQRNERWFYQTCLFCRFCRFWRFCRFVTRVAAPVDALAVVLFAAFGVTFFSAILAHLPE
jgi:hypothetical protein